MREYPPMIHGNGSEGTWIPEGAWQPKIGDRVWTRLSGECEASMPYSTATRYGITGCPMELNGAHGVIIPHASWYQGPAGHNLAVELDARVTIRGLAIKRWAFALAELEPLEDAEAQP